MGKSKSLSCCVCRSATVWDPGRPVREVRGCAETEDPVCGALISIKFCHATHGEVKKFLMSPNLKLEAATSSRLSVRWDPSRPVSGYVQKLRTRCVGR